ncbi:MAG: hypothetical protein Q4C70_05210 [Planctomycetia bacterium]|nr:hypothetical protein [Planctomycetia bacterium]
MNRTFPEDEPYRRQLLTEAGLNPELHARIRSIVGPSEMRAIVKAFQNQVSFYQPGERPTGREREVDTHSLENVYSGQFRANLHIHTRHSDGRLSISTLLRQSAIYADRVASSLTEMSVAPYAPFTIGIADHNRVEGCVEVIQRIYESPRRFRNLRIILGSEVTIRFNAIGPFPLKNKRHAHFLMQCILPQNPKLEEFFLPFADALPPTHRSFAGAPSVTLSQAAQFLKTQKFGLLSVAHPLRLQLRRILVEPQYQTEAMRQYIHLFKILLGSRAFYVEAFYQAYTGNLATNMVEFRTILETAAAEHLLVAGGMDTHGNNIFFSNISPRFPF